MAIRIKYRKLPKSPPFSPLSSRSVDYYLKQAKKTGRLNLTQKRLTEIPQEVFNFPNLHFDDELNNEVPLKIVDLSNNLITTIDELPESSFGSCTHLFIKQNNLTHLPELFTQFPHLQLLDASWNHLSEISLSSQTLRVLDVSGNCLKRITFGQLCCLESLHIENNAVEIIEGLEHCKKLRTLVAEKNKFKTFPNHLFSLKNLTLINFNNNLIEEIPSDISRLDALRVLSVSQNKISLLPTLPKSIIELRASNNNIKTFPKLNNLTELKLLDLSENQINEIPDEIDEFVQLERFNISYNYLSKLNPRLALLQHLVVLNVKGNHFRFMRTDLCDKGVDAILDYLKVKLKHDDKKEAMPDDVLSAKHYPFYTEEVILAKEKLSIVPPKIKEYKRLKTINLSSNAISVLNDDFALNSTATLETVLLNANKFTKFPTALYNYHSLKTVDLSYNSITTLPTEIAPKMPQLRVLRLRHCGVETFPPVVMSLESIQELDLGENKLTVLPEEIIKMEKLTVLDISFNGIRRIPPCISLLKNTLRWLNIEGNPVSTINHGVIEKGTWAIMELLEKRFDQQIHFPKVVGK